MTKRELLAQLASDGGDLDGEVEVYISEGGTEGWYAIAAVEQTTGIDPSNTVISVGDCLAANSAVSFT